MAINVADNFSYKGGKPLDARTKYASVSDMVATPAADLYDGCLAYVTATKKNYQYDSTNESIETYGKWRELQTGGGGGTSDYTDLTNKPQIEGVTLSGNKSASDLGLVTKAVNDLVNYYLKSETYSKTEVDNIVTAIKNSRFEAVSTLPTSNIKTNVIYLVPSSDPQTANAKDEYINLDGTTAGWELIGSTNIDLSGYVTTTDLNTALADYTTTTDLTALLAAKQDKIQYSSMPTASADYLGKVVQYVGATASPYTHGYYYECVSDGEATPTYSWQQTNVQPSSGGGGSYTAGAGIDITNNEISTKQSQEGDIDEIIDVYPQAGNLVSIVNAFNKGDIYSTEEKMIGQWTDGKPLYQKTFVQSISVAVGDTTYVGDLSGLNIDFGTVSEYVMIDTNGYATALTHFDVWLRVPQNNIGVTNKSTQSKAGQMYVTIQYTKTTDVAISIGEETEYSTDEKVVGTWIDGRPVYQKTWTGLNVSVPVDNDWHEIIGTDIPKSSIIVDAQFYFYASAQSTYARIVPAEIMTRATGDTTGVVGVLKLSEARTIAIVTAQYVKPTT